MVVSVCALKPGEAGRVVRTEILGAHGRRLRELGVLPGARVKLFARAPLGDPMALDVGGSRLAIRARDARGIYVRGEAIA